MARLTRLSHTLNRREGGGGIRVMPPVQAWISLKNEAKKKIILKIKSYNNKKVPIKYPGDFSHSAFFFFFF